MSNQIEGLIWQPEATPYEKRPIYPLKRLKAILTKGKKTEYLWFTFHGLTQIIGREINGKDIVDHVVEIAPEDEWLIPYKK